MILRTLREQTSFYRVLALSATPGAKKDDIQDVISNLQISNVECRTSEDPDVRYRYNT